SFRNGFAAQMKGKKKGKRFVRLCMGMFAAAIVIFAGVYGRKTADLFDIKKSVNGNMIAVRADLPGAERVLADAFENRGTSGIDYYYYADFAGSVGEQEVLKITPAYYISGGSGVVLSAEGTPLPESLADGLRVLAGEKKVSDTSIWISRYMADRFLKTSTVSFIKNYSDLIGLKAGNYDVAAVIDTSEPVYYLPDSLLQELNIERLGLKIQKTSDPEAGGGKVVFMSFDSTFPGVGDTVMINGKKFEIAGVRGMYGCYADWLREKYPEHWNLCERLFRGGIMSEQLLDAARDDSAFAEAYSASSEPDFEGLAYLYAYRYFDEWVKYCTENNLVSLYSAVPELFYVYKAGVLDDAKYPAFGDYGWYGDDAGYMTESFSGFYSVLKYYRSHGRVVNKTDAVSDFSYSIDYLVNAAMELYYKLDTSGIAAPYRESFFMLGPEDYAIASTGYGESDTAADGGLYRLKNETEALYSSPYLVAHCSDYGKALKLITAEYGAPDGYSPDVVSPGIITPKYQFDERLAEEGLSVIGGVIPFAVVVALLCVSVYFMIRSTLMNRVKDVGIYRAIGVTKNNLRFSFMAETLALTCTSVVPWFAVFSALLFLTLKRSTIAGNTIFYPPWFAALLLVFVLGICVICGIMPINRLLRKTPAELLAKYDI
ncbi:MAG: ABC transporter permease, partial [Clostridia bacterium]|nr:ABC transporter permease [Clostridia bacterium]